MINRHTVRDLLLRLAESTTTSGAGGRTRGEQRAILDALADSGLEKEFVLWLDDQGFRLPDRAQVSVSEAKARPDLVFDLPTGPVAVFIDGPVHDGAVQAQRDNDAEERLADAGWAIVRFRYDDDWDTVVHRYPSVFGTRRSESPTA
jgi:hypothetical protein